MEIFTKNSAKYTVFQSTICNKFSSLMKQLSYWSKGRYVLSTGIQFALESAEITLAIFCAVPLLQNDMLACF
jgi:hypothetical protein